MKKPKQKLTTEQIKQLAGAQLTQVTGGRTKVLLTV